MSDRAPVLSGAPAIARALGCSPKTVYRRAKEGTLPVFRAGQNTSPLRIKRKCLAEIRRGQPNRVDD